ncbi:MAG: DUF4082 domain-containing protein, partial [Jatrophihabitantaceae bacterium]
STSPAAGATNALVSTTPSATFSKAMNAATLSFSLKSSAGVSVAGTAAYNATSQVYTFTPSAALTSNATYTATVNGSDTTGVALTAAYSWTFSTAAAGTGGPTVASVTPAPSSTDVATATSPTVTFGGVVNPSTMSFTIQDTTGSQATGTTSYNPTTLTATFNPTQPLSAGLTYTATVSVSDASGTPMAAPYTWSFSTVPAGPITGPTAASVTPLNTATSVSVAVAPQAVLTSDIAPASLVFTLKDATGTAVAGAASYVSATKTATFTPAAALSRGVKYTASVSATDLAGVTSSAPFVWSFTTAQPSPTPGVCPCSVWDDAATPDSVTINDPHSVELGVKFTADVAGQITGIRFYKGPQNTGTHTGSLWGNDGTLLATATFGTESATGWQTVSFATPVTVTANTTYLVSYHTNVGYYSETYGGSFAANGVDNPPLHVPAHPSYYLYGSGFPTGASNSNYWVDPVFATTLTPPGDTTPPTVTKLSPLNTATSVATSAAPTATFSEPINPASLTFTLADDSNNPVAGTASYDAPTQVATFTPTAALAQNVKYTASVTASDVAGNAMPTSTTWSFTTIPPNVTPSNCPCSMWNDSALPDTPSVNDGHAVEVGVQFSADRAGYISGVQFFKGPQNTGSHTGSLWTSTGTLLATATFAGESASGWQQVSFTNPVAITANTTYIASYYAPVGFYAETYGGTFASTGIDNSPLHMPAHPGLYLYGTGGLAPTNGSNSNYWVDPVFNDTNTAPADVTAPVVTNVTAAGSGTTATVTWTTDEAATSTVQYGTSAGSLTSTASTSGLSTAHSVALNGLTASTTYYLRVVSADATNNSTTSPATANAPASFSPADITAPVVSSVAATGSGATATVTWTTDEVATSVVNYGTSATTLSSSASTAGLATSHSVALSGLAANTRYYYRVVSADAAGNTTTSPASGTAAASFAAAIAPVTDTTTASFTAGVVSAAYVASNGDGEVVLAPAAVQEFAGTTVPTGWTSTATVTGGKTTLASGIATVSGANLTSTATYGNARSLIVQATLDKNQSIGWVTSSSSTTKMTFSVNTAGQLIATSNDGAFNSGTAVVASAWVAAAHNFRIEWTSSAATFYLDNVQVYTKAFTTRFGTTYRPLLADTATTDTALAVDWMRIGPYAATGSFTSRVIDGLAAVSWDGLSWDATVPTGTTLVVKVRGGNTATPDASWSAYQTIASSGASIGLTIRYLQYQLTLTSSGSRFVSPAVRSVTAALHA